MAGSTQPRDGRVPGTDQGPNAAPGAELPRRPPALLLRRFDAPVLRPTPWEPFQGCFMGSADLPAI